ncbi:unnamed protein product [Sphenostylis stenocarpa]|uniref:Macrophage migration inhibitory factor n=1 Tax=Sphenostylis stenocarpa TaxID=92480 RepID=A0AA86RVT3_9FABA|nr:unnamed protein product [Sphenostylis stenocarpa]
MPCLNLSTNVNLDGVDTSSILSEATSTVANIIGKPEAYVMIVLKGSVPISFGGNEQPAAYGELVSIGGLSPDVNKKLSAGIAAILETKLSVPKSRFFLKFYDTKAWFQLWMEWNYILSPSYCGNDSMDAMDWMSDELVILFQNFFLYQYSEFHIPL